MSTIPINTQESPPFLLDLIYRLKVKDVMTHEVITARRETPLRQIQYIMKEKGITGVPITDDEGKRLFGIVSMDDIIRALDGGYIQDPAERWMSRNLIVLEDDMPLQFAISYLDKFRYGRFPVLNKDRELVGIITSRDIIIALLVEVNKEVEKLEQRIVQPPSRPGEEARLLYHVRKYDFENAGKASAGIKKLLLERNLDPKTLRRISVAAYELEMNLVVHSEGGTLSFRMEKDRVEIEAKDRGPGIPDVEQAMEEGFSTANEWIRSLGFGAGMGLPNAKRVSDEFTIDSRVGEGTTVRAVIYLPK
ncbi:MAG: CBS domain-containing protein [Spirochaetes bacterium]|nr:CBS domain-containing protein [Spirochaetota bacterium]